MADDKHYVMGDFYRICDMTGFKVRAGKTRKMWTNTIRRTQSWEPRQPQDFVKGVRDDQNVPDPRPRSVNQFQGPLGTILSATAVPQLNAPWFISVESAVRFFINDTLHIMMDIGENAKVKIIDVPNSGTVQIDRSLPHPAAAGNIVINVSAESDAIISYPGENN